MRPRPGKMGALLWALLVSVTACLAQVQPIENKPKLKYGKADSQVSVSATNQNGHRNGNHEFALEGESKVGQHIDHVAVFSGLQQPQAVQVDTPASRLLVKREAKKPENKKRRRKFNKKKMEKIMAKTESKSKSEKSASEPSSSSSSQSEDSETPESSLDSSGTYESSDDSSEPSGSSYESSDESSEPDSSDFEYDSSEGSSKASSSEESSEKSSKSRKKSKKYDSSSCTTEEVSLTSEEETEEIYSGPDSSPPNPSDSTDESSASRHIKGSSDISYTMSSSASVYSSSEETSEESDSSEDSGGKKKKGSKSKENLKSAEVNVTTKVKNKKGKKVTEVKIQFDEKKTLKDETKEIKMKKLKNNDKEKDLEMKAEEVKGHEKSKEHTAGVPNPLHMAATTEKVLRMVEHPGNTHQQTGNTDAASEKPKMEMMKVKPAKEYSKKIEDLEHDLNRDYPGNDTVEIVNWEGTFPPIHGEPYVAPLHKQPDSFWDAIYRSTDPDLPTPPGADVSLPQITTEPQLELHNSVVKSQAGEHHVNPVMHDGVHVQHQLTASQDGLEDGMLMKTKDKAKKEKKKPKLSPKEKKKKKKEKLEKENPNNLARPPPGGRRVEGVRNINNIQVKSQGGEHTLNAVMHSNGGQHVQISSQKHVMHAAGKSEENLKTPSEEERESGTTYKPEGAYEYPSFRHPDFNPDTAYDENGIPIHESPGWTPPPTLPGDHRFGKERSRPGAGLSGRVQVHGPGPLAKPLVGQPHSMDSHHPQGQFHENSLHKVIEKSQDPHQTLADHEHQHLAEALNSVHMRPLSSQERSANKELIEPHHGNLHDIPVVLPAQHQGSSIKDAVVNHKIQKRAASESGSKESLGKQKKPVQREPHREAARDYKAYKLSDSELQHKEKSSPLEALNPALYMHRNMLKARRKRRRRKLSLDKIPESAEVIAVVVSPQGGSRGGPKIMGQVDLRTMHKMSYTKAPVVYSRKNEAHNPLLYKHRNMFKVSDLKDDGIRITQDMMRQAAFNNNPQGNRNAKSGAMEDLLNNRILRGRGRENFNPLFINQKKMFNVRTNKFKPASTEDFIVKREIKESQNPHLYSYQNIFSSNPKQLLPLENTQINTKQEQASAVQPNVNVPQTEVDPSRFEGGIFGRKVPVIDADSEEKALDPKIKQYVGKNNEAMNPYLMNYPNMFAVNNKIPVQSKSQNLDASIEKHKQKNVATPNKPLDPNVFNYVGRIMENLNPYLYKYSNMFTVNANKPLKEANRVKSSLHKVQLNKGGVNPVLFAYKQMAPVFSNKVETHKVKKRED